MGAPGVVAGVEEGAGTVPERRGDWHAWALPLLLLAAGTGAALGARSYARPAALLGSSALLLAGAGAAVRAARARRGAPGTLRGERLLLAAAAAPDGAPSLERIALALAEALGGPVAFQGAAGEEAESLVAHPDAGSRERLQAQLAAGRWSAVDDALRQAEPYLLGGFTQPPAGGLMEATGARSALSVPVRSAGGQVVGWLAATGTGTNSLSGPELSLAISAAALAGVALDVERLRREAEAAARARANFLSVVSHELKTPLNVVLGYADLLLLDVPVRLAPEARSHVERLRASALLLLARVDDILTYVQLGQGQTTLDEHPVRVDLRELVQEAVSELEENARAKGLDLRAETPAESVILLTQPQALGRLLRILLGNAVKFTRSGSVRAQLSGSASTAVVRIVDTGPGMPTEQAARAFEPFWQANPGPARREGGLGLGLAAARALARALGAEVTLESAPGLGTTATVVLTPARARTA